MESTQTRADHWQLYTSKAGAEEVARKLDEALVKVKEEARKDVYNGTPVKDALIAHTRLILLPVMSKYAHMGAYDTEPLYVMQDELTEIASSMAGGRVEISRWEV